MWTFLVELERWNNAHQSGEDNTKYSYRINDQAGNWLRGHISEEVGAAGGVGREALSVHCCALRSRPFLT